MMARGKAWLDPNSKYAVAHRYQGAGAEILDVGCGLDSARKLKQHAIDAHVDGADIQEYYMTADGKSAMRNYWIFTSQEFNMRLGELPIRYDLIVLSHVIEHVVSPNELILALFRLLKPGGRIYISTPTALSIGFPSLKKGCLNFHDDKTHIQPVDLMTFKQMDPEVVLDRFIPRNYGSWILYFVGLILTPVTLWSKRILPFVWYYYGFESVAIFVKKKNKQDARNG